MLRAQAGNHYIFGLTKENVQRLTAGQPITITLNEDGLTGPAISIVLCYGETEEQIALELQALFSPTTTIHDRRSSR